MKHYLTNWQLPLVTQAFKKTLTQAVAKKQISKSMDVPFVCKKCIRQMWPSFQKRLKISNTNYIVTATFKVHWSNLSQLQMEV